MRHQYLWRKQANRVWLRENETTLLADFAERVAFIERPGKTRTTVEISCATSRDASDIVRTFGGKVSTRAENHSGFASEPLKVRLALDNSQQCGRGLSAPTRRESLFSVGAPRPLPHFQTASHHSGIGSVRDERTCNDRNVFAHARMRHARMGQRLEYARCRNRERNPRAHCEMFRSKRCDRQSITTLARLRSRKKMRA